MRAPPWTDEEVALLIEIAATHTIPECLAKLPGRTEGSIQGKASRLGLTVKHLVKAYAWTEEEDQHLTRIFETVSIPALAREMGRTTHSIRRRAKALGLTRSKRVMVDSWTRADDSMLKVHYGSKSTQTLSKTLNRTVAAIHRHARDLGLATPCEKRPWTLEDDRALLLAAGRKNAAQIAKDLGRTRGAVCARARNMGLSLRNRMLDLQQLQGLLNPVDGEPWFNQHTFRQWRLAGLTTSRPGGSNGVAYVTAARLRNFWKERPEALDIYALDEATLDEFDLDIDSWPEPPNFKVIGCTGRKGAPHRLILNSFDLYSTSNWCSCGNHLSQWAHAYCNDELTPAGKAAPDLDRGLPERSILSGIAPPRRRHAQRTQQESEGGLAQAPDAQPRGR